MEDILILAIDIGNTNIVVGCIRGDEVLFTERLSTNTTHTTLEYAISFKNVLEIYQIDAPAPYLDARYLRPASLR